jgi:dUTP pyrophosphatase
MKLYIKPANDYIKGIYENHGSFHDGDIGIDLFIVKEQTCRAFETTIIDFEIQCEPDDSNQGYMLVPRSSIGKTPLRQANCVGIIDGGYRGNLKVMVDNIYDTDFVIKEGFRLFQLVSFDGKPIQFEIVDQLSETTRGEGGFGSTGN